MPDRSVGAHRPEVAQLLRSIEIHEQMLRRDAGRLLQLLPADDDLATAVRRLLDGLEV